MAARTLTPAKTSQIEIIKPGWFTTVQDLGRYGSQQYGVPVSGAMDRFAAIVGNRLVGNPDHAALLECTLKGPELVFPQDTVIAITGADLSPTIDDTTIPLWERILVQRDSRLRFGAQRSGSRAYLAIVGGIDVPLVLGSRSTHDSSMTGGWEGRALKSGDILPAGRPTQSIEHLRMMGKRLPDHLRPRYDQSITLRVIPSPQQEHFSESALTILTESSYHVAPQSNRMGYRLTGPKLVRTESASYISDGTAMGALQVPTDGQPILLMADRQTTGGYPNIAVVISADLPLAAQLLPGNTIQFHPCSLTEAQTILRARYESLDAALPPQ